jgi:hypothetical protein
MKRRSMPDDYLPGVVRTALSHADSDCVARAYLAFARELVAVQRQTPVPDYSERAKAVVAKWFRRGLSARVMAEIAQLLWAAGPGEEGQLARR